MPFHTFCSAKFSTCIAVRLLKFSVLHGKGESKYRPVATNFQCLKNCCPHGLALVGVRLLHLLRKPCCRSKAPLGLSLLRNRGLVGECLPQTLLQLRTVGANAACRAYIASPRSYRNDRRFNDQNECSTLAIPSTTTRRTTKQMKSRPFFFHTPIK